MISDIDTALTQYLSGRAVSAVMRSAHISFETPKSGWDAELAKSAINCFLYACGENSQLRSEEPVIRRKKYPDAGMRVWREPPALRLECRYRLTAWSSAQEPRARVREEHALLSEVIRLLFTHRTLGEADLDGTQLAAREAPPFIEVKPLPIQDSDESDFWSALGQPPRPSIKIAVQVAWHLVPKDKGVQAIEQIHLAQDLKPQPPQDDGGESAAPEISIIPGDDSEGDP